MPSVAGDLSVASALDLVAGAKTPADIFGTDPDQARRIYRRLSRVLHPDATIHATEARRKAATAAFGDMARSWVEYQQGKIAKPVVLSSRRHTFALGSLLATGDIANLYHASFLVKDAGATAVVKMPRDPADSDLMEREVTALKAMESVDLPPYPAGLIDTFRHRDASSGAQRRVNVIRPLVGWFNLTEVCDAYPAGVDLKDIAWIWRRVLMNLHVAHSAGVVHGAVLPPHVMVHPFSHEVALVDWCYSSTGHSTIPAVVNAYSDWYPPEVSTKTVPDASTDIYLAANTMRHLIDWAEPRSAEHRRFRSFFNGCIFARPDDAWALLLEFDELIEKLWGARRFHLFTMPARA